MDEKQKKELMEIELLVMTAITKPRTAKGHVEAQDNLAKALDAIKILKKQDAQD